MTRRQPKRRFKIEFALLNLTYFFKRRRTLPELNLGVTKQSNAVTSNE